MPHPMKLVAAPIVAAALLATPAPAAATTAGTATTTQAVSVVEQVAARALAPSTLRHRRHVSHLHHLHVLHLIVEAARKAASGARTRVLRVAASYRGVPYVYGGSSRRGADCSGYVDAVFREAVHKTLPRTVAGLRRAARTPRRVQPGDLIFYGTSHVAIVAKVVRGRVALTWVARHTGTTITTQVPYAAFTVGAVLA